MQVAVSIVAVGPKLLEPLPLQLFFRSVIKVTSPAPLVRIGGPQYPVPRFVYMCVLPSW